MLAALAAELEGVDETYVKAGQRVWREGKFSGRKSDAIAIVKELFQRNKIGEEGEKRFSLVLRESWKKKLGFSGTEAPRDEASAMATDEKEDKTDKSSEIGAASRTKRKFSESTSTATTENGAPSIREDCARSLEKLRSALSLCLLTRSSTDEVTAEKTAEDTQNKKAKQMANAESTALRLIQDHFLKSFTTLNLPRELLCCMSNAMFSNGLPSRLRNACARALGSVSAAIRSLFSEC